MSFHGERAQACCDLTGHDAPPPCPPPQLDTDLPGDNPRDGTRRAGEHQPHTLTRRSHSWSYTSQVGRTRSPQRLAGFSQLQTHAVSDDQYKQHPLADRPMFHTLTDSDHSRQGTVNDAVNYHIPAYSLDESDRSRGKETGNSDDALPSIKPGDACECPHRSLEIEAEPGVTGHCRQQQGKESEPRRGGRAFSQEQPSATGLYPSLSDPEADAHAYVHPDHGHHSLHAANPRYLKNRRYGQVTPPYRMNDSDEEQLALEGAPVRPPPPLRRLSDLRSLTLTLGLQIHGSILNLAADKSRKQVHKDVVYLFSH